MVRTRLAGYNFGRTGETPREARVPELPEVETVVRCLRPALVGRRLSAPRVTGKALRRGWQAAWQERLHQQPMVRTVERRGKWILIRLDRGDGLLAHLGMTGRLHVVPADRPLAPHTHLVFPLAPGDQELRYRDTRRFGLVEWMTEGKLEAFLAERLGPDPFSLRGEEFYRALRRTRRGLKTALLDQRVVAGLGNIYADEALFAAQLSPFRKGSGIRVKEAGRLLLAIQRVLRRAIKMAATPPTGPVERGGAGRIPERVSGLPASGPAMSALPDADSPRVPWRAVHPLLPGLPAGRGFQEEKAEGRFCRGGVIGCCSGKAGRCAVFSGRRSW